MIIGLPTIRKFNFIEKFRSWFQPHDPMWGHLDDGIRSIAMHISSSPDSSPSASGNSTPTRSTETSSPGRSRSLPNPEAPRKAFTSSTRGPRVLYSYMDDLIAVAPPRNEALNELRGDLDAAATHTDNDTDPQAAPSFPWASILAHTDDTFIPHRTCACT